MSRKLAPRPLDPSATQTPSPISKIPEREERLKTCQQRNFNHHHGARELSPLIPGQKVSMPYRDQEAQVTQEAGTRSYEVQTSDGTYRRNHKALICIPDSPDQNSDDSVNTNATEPNQPFVGVVENPTLQISWTQAATLNSELPQLETWEGRCSID